MEPLLCLLHSDYFQFSRELLVFSAWAFRCEIIYILYILMFMFTIVNAYSCIYIYAKTCIHIYMHAYMCVVK